MDSQSQNVEFFDFENLDDEKRQQVCNILQNDTRSCTTGQPQFAWITEPYSFEGPEVTTDPKYKETTTPDVDSVPESVCSEITFGGDPLPIMSSMHQPITYYSMHPPTFTGGIPMIPNMHYGVPVTFMGMPHPSMATLPLNCMPHPHSVMTVPGIAPPLMHHHSHPLVQPIENMHLHNINHRVGHDLNPSIRQEVITVHSGVESVPSEAAKTYERRNKKRRPPDYYKRLEEQEAQERKALEDKDTSPVQDKTFVVEKPNQEFGDAVAKDMTITTEENKIINEQNSENLYINSSYKDESLLSFGDNPYVPNNSLMNDKVVNGAVSFGENISNCTDDQKVDNLSHGKFCPNTNFHNNSDSCNSSITFGNHEENSFAKSERKSLGFEDSKNPDNSCTVIQKECSVQNVNISETEHAMASAPANSEEMSKFKTHPKQAKHEIKSDPSSTQHKSIGELNAELHRNKHSSNSDSNTNVHYPKLSSSSLPHASSSAVFSVSDTSLHVSTADSVPPPSLATSKPSPWSKPNSWAGLFTKEAQNATVIYSMGDGVSVDPKVSGPTMDKNNENEEPLSTVPADEDKSAKKLGDFFSEYTLNHKSISLQPRGLTNKNVWCYINSTLQALLACPPFYHLIKSLPMCNAKNRGPTSTPVMDTIVQFVNEFNTMPFKPLESKALNGKGTVKQDIPAGKVFEPTYVYKLLQLNKYDSAFKLGRQEDAEEFLSCLLNGLHDEMCSAMKVSSGEISVVSAIGVQDEVVETQEVFTESDADGGWEQVGPKNKSVITRNVCDENASPISDIFRGQIRSVVQQQGERESATLQPFFSLQLDIQQENVASVKDALNNLVSKESISGYTCNKTKKEVEITRRIMLENLPPVLLLHLKCFVYDQSGGSQKLAKHIEYSVDLEINKELLAPNVRGKYSNPATRKYKLFAVVNHHGPRAVGGHYTTYTFHPGLAGWVHYDDSIIRPVSLPSLMKHKPNIVPYLLYYRRVDLN